MPRLSVISPACVLFVILLTVDLKCSDSAPYETTTSISSTIEDDAETVSTVFGEIDYDGTTETAEYSTPIVQQRKKRDNDNTAATSDLQGSEFFWPRWGGGYGGYGGYGGWGGYGGGWGGWGGGYGGGIWNPWWSFRTW